MSHDLREDLRARTSTGRVVVSVQSYSDAAAAIDRLAEKDFPVERVTIVGRGLRLLEHVVGRRGAAQAAAEGAVTGAAIGGATGIVFGLFTVVEAGLGLGLLVWGIVTGAVLGALIGLAAQAFPLRRRFDSVSSLESEHYDVVVDESVAGEAERLLSGWTVPGPGGPAADAPRPSR